MAYSLEAGGGSTKVSSVMKDANNIEKTTINQAPERPLKKQIENFIKENGLFKKTNL